MAITFHDDIGWFASSELLFNDVLPTHSAGDMLLIRASYKSSAIATCVGQVTGSGWGIVGEFHDGTTNSGNGTGSVAVVVFWKVAASSSEASPTITGSQVTTQSGIAGISYSKAADETWETPVGAGGGFAAATNISATIGTHISVVSGDMVDFFYGARDDSTATVPTITQTGVTYATVVEMPAAANSDTSGADGAYDGGYRLATAGTSSAAAVVTGTLSTSESGSAWMTRLRVIAAAVQVPYVNPMPPLIAQ